MNQLRQFKQCWRQVGDLTIVFYKKDTIYIIDADHQTIIHRWFKVRNSWNSWRLMVDGFKRRKKLNYGQALGLAIRHGFGTASARKIPNYEKFERIKDETDN